MPKVVVNGAQISCSFGTAPSALVVPSPLVTAGGQPVAKIADMAPMTNIMPFLMCMTPSNPQVAAATSAALGVLTPQPCIPVITAPWSPGSPKASMSGLPVLTASSTCMCAWGGAITIASPGQVIVDG